MKRLYLYLIAIFLGANYFSNAQTIVKTLVHDGLERSYRVHIPANYEAGDQLPLVLNFHGFNSSGFEQELYSQMSPLADSKNFFVVYPDGAGLIPSWNVGWTLGSQEDDIGFTDAMIDSIYANYGIDTSRIYSCGMSNGGFFSYELACALNDRIAKIASVTGSMLVSKLEACEIENPIPVMQIHGTDDDIVNYNGTNGISMSIEDLLAGWRDLNNCASISDTIMISNVSESDFSTAELIQWRDCDADTYMAFYKIDGGGHTWPGALIEIPGNTNRDFSATREIWDFFDDQYPKDVVVDVEELRKVQQEKVFVFPNPFVHSFYIANADRRDFDISIFDARGQLIHQVNSNDAPIRIYSQDWPQGLYIAQVKSARGTTTINLLKK